MNALLFIMRSAIEDFRRNKMRTLLTSLGILIGVASVVLLLAFGLGLKAYIKNQFESLGSNLIYIIPGTFGGTGFRPGTFGATKFDEKDLTTLKKIEHINAIAAIYTKTVTISSAGKSEVSDLFAATQDIFPVRTFEVDTGRLFTKSDVEKRAKVAVLGPKLSEKLFDSTANAVDKNVKVNGQGYKVIGVLKSKGGGFGGPDFDSFVYVPYTAASQFNPDKKFISFYLKADSDQSLVVVKDQAKKLLTKRYKEDVFSVVEQTEILSTVTSIFNVFNIVLVAIGAISLVVGGVGIMNIMYVTVTERIKEIGIRRAIGATRRDILTQFLAEAVILSLLGGVAGLTIAFIVVLFVQRFFPAYIDLPSVLISLVVSSVVGIVFGVLPAKRAADLSPIDAIRYE